MCIACLRSYNFASIVSEVNRGFREHWLMEKQRLQAAYDIQCSSMKVLLFARQGERNLVLFLLRYKNN